jgi:predicted Zn-dependent peptidase
MRPVWTVALALALALPAALASSPARAQTASPITEKNFKVQRHALDNGLVVLLHEDHSVPAVTFWQWYKVGSRNERPGITGLSHFFEHMMFNGSKNVPPKEYDRIIESNGGTSNAFTSRDMTAYYEDIAADRVEVLYRLDSDRMAGLTLEPEILKSEIEVVKEERRLRTDNSIFGMLDEQLYATAFNASPYNWPVVGWMNDLETVGRDDLVAYYRTYYAPNNCILVLSGDFDSAAALKQLRDAFGQIPSQPQPPPPVNSEPEQRGERRAKVHYPAQQVTFMGGYKAPPVSDPDHAVLDVLSSILGDGESSRLHRALVYDKQVALAAGTFYQTSLEPGLFEFYVMMKPGESADAGVALVDEVFETLKKEGPSARELQKAKNLLEAQFVKQLKTNNGAGQTLGFYEHVYGDFRKMYSAIDHYKTVTIDDCKRVAQKYYVPTKRTIVEIVPDDGGETAQAHP